MSEIFIVVESDWSTSEIKGMFPTVNSAKRLARKLRPLARGISIEAWLYGAKRSYTLFPDVQESGRVLWVKRLV